MREIILSRLDTYQRLTNELTSCENFEDEAELYYKLEKTYQMIRGIVVVAEEKYGIKLMESGPFMDLDAEDLKRKVKQYII